MLYQSLPSQHGDVSVMTCSDWIKVQKTSVTTCTSIIEPEHDKTNKMTCVLSKDSDQLGHLPSLIRVFDVRLKKPWVLSYTLNARQTRAGSDQTGWMPRVIWVLSLLDAQNILLVCRAAAQFFFSWYVSWQCCFVIWATSRENLSSVFAIS